MLELFVCGWVSVCLIVGACGCSGWLFLGLGRWEVRFLLGFGFCVASALCLGLLAMEWGGLGSAWRSVLIYRKQLILLENIHALAKEAKTLRSRRDRARTMLCSSLLFSYLIFQPVTLICGWFAVASFV